MEYTLNERDRALVDQVVKREMARHLNVRRTSEVGGLDDQEVVHAPEIYVARTPAGGIPALNEGSSTGTGTGTGTLDAGGDEPGYAPCHLWKVVYEDDGITAYFEEISRHPLYVYNLSLTAVPEYTWIIVMRDKPGTWWAVTGGGGNGINVCGTPPTADVTGTSDDDDCILCEERPELIRDVRLVKFSCDFETEEFEDGDCDEGGTGTGTGTDFEGLGKTVLIRKRGYTGEHRTGIANFVICDDCTILTQYQVVCVENGRIIGWKLDPPVMPECP